jgi:hypothetical protein
MQIYIIHTSIIVTSGIALSLNGTSYIGGISCKWKLNRKSGITLVIDTHATTGRGPIAHRGALLSTLLCKSHFHKPQQPVHIIYRGALLSTLLHVSLISTSHNRPSTYQLQRSATEPSSTCKSHSHKPKQAQYLSVTEERY